MNGERLSSSQVARRLGLSISRVQQLLRAGKLDYESTPLGRLVSEASVERLLEERRQQASLHQRRR